jgi:hypothetical protein
MIDANEQQKLERQRRLDELFSSARDVPENWRPKERIVLESVGEMVDYLFDSGVHVFSDVAGEAWFRWTDPPETLVGSETEGDKPRRRPECLVPIPSRKLRAILAGYFFVEEIALPKPNALTEVLLILEGIAFFQREPCDVGEAAEADPVLEALLFLLETTPDWEGTSSDLLAALRRVSRERGWQLDQHPNWPKNASHLSRCVRNVLEFLEEAGFAYEYRRSDSRRCHCFSRAGEVQAEVIGEVGMSEATADGNREAPQLSGRMPNPRQASEGIADVTSDGDEQRAPRDESLGNRNGRPVTSATHPATLPSGRALTYSGTGCDVTNDAKAPPSVAEELPSLVPSFASPVAEKSSAKYDGNDANRAPFIPAAAAVMGGRDAGQQRAERSTSRNHSPPLPSPVRT